MKTKIPYRFPILQIKDKIFGDVHTYGTDSHDGYEFVYTPDEGGYEGIKEVYSEWDSPRDGNRYDEMSKEELIWQCMLKDLQIRGFLKTGARHES